ncbi:Transesterase (LovD), putative [Penicillium digitatum]|uniref:Transesterase (LovD), putative n=3 Tax=Penicillium digitatum TaxID=36651 RepID=K9GD92_PEND2|nr:Transesterase (LovD), putative [Penicillium digitatum Pd1]EKV19089.1 Transesterase (LovD), putative [Penicillium digitatum PHI26]EKV20998.1 Transesterase (LovD), putative [Penicillium digitatum Pd1]QQK48323.1 Transesterase (LovD), putative [Penicillium digitatum]
MLKATSYTTRQLENEHYSGEKQPQQLDDVLYLASATKLITTIAALQCVEDGLLTLDGDLSSITPELATRHVLTGFAEDGSPQLDSPARPITLKMLLTHSSGISYYFLNPMIAKWHTHFQPGAGWMYGPGLDWAGRGDFGGHGLFISGLDFVKILRSLLANDGKLLNANTVDNMFQQHLGPEEAADHQAALAGPIGPFFRVGIDPELKVGYGLGGLLTLEDVDGWYGERTLTWGGGLTLTWFIDRKNNLSGVCAIQAVLPVDGDLVAELKQTFRHDIYHK